MNKSKFLKATHCTEIRKIEIPRFMVFFEVCFRPVEELIILLLYV